MKLRFITIITLFIIVTACSENKTTKNVTSKLDYNIYVESTDQSSLNLAQADFDFWKHKLSQTPNQFPYLVKASASQSQIFNKTGNISALIASEQYLIEANKKTNYTKTSYLRALAKNYISQHRFRESLELLKKAEDLGENLKATKKMLFDVYLELGNTKLAKSYLNSFENFNDFDYLIRISKWSDHQGDLEGAIKYLNKAKLIAESSNIPDLKQWVYTNLADYYGHAGNIKKSYELYLKALELDPSDAYAKKGIAWILYSHEKNADEALRIIKAIEKSHKSPDYHLFKAELAEYKGDYSLQKKELNQYKNVVKNTLYGDMYNKYNVLLLAKNKETHQEALIIAKREIENRPTVQSYDLLAWVYFNQGNLQKASEIIDKHVIGKTSEPEVLLHIAHILNAKGNISQVKALKEELIESTFEIGPISTKEIQSI